MLLVALILLQEYVKSKYDMQLPYHQINLRGILGDHVSSLYRFLLKLYAFHLDIAALQIGSNDISETKNFEPMLHLKLHIIVK